MLCSVLLGCWDIQALQHPLPKSYSTLRSVSVGYKLPSVWCLCAKLGPAHLFLSCINRLVCVWMTVLLFTKSQPAMSEATTFLSYMCQHSSPTWCVKTVECEWNGVIFKHLGGDVLFNLKVSVSSCYYSALFSICFEGSRFALILPLLSSSALMTRCPFSPPLPCESYGFDKNNIGDAWPSVTVISLSLICFLANHN